MLYITIIKLCHGESEKMNSKAIPMQLKKEVTPVSVGFCIYIHSIFVGIFHNRSQGIYTLSCVRLGYASL